MSKYFVKICINAQIADIKGSNERYKLPENGYANSSFIKLIQNDGSAYSSEDENMIYH